MYPKGVVLSDTHTLSLSQIVCVSECVYGYGCRCVYVCVPLCVRLCVCVCERESESLHHTHYRYGHAFLWSAQVFSASCIFSPHPLLVSIAKEIYCGLRPLQQKRYSPGCRKYDLISKRFEIRKNYQIFMGRGFPWVWWGARGMLTMKPSGWLT